MKFKRGDKIVILVDRPCASALMKGDIETVKKAYIDGYDGSESITTANYWSLRANQARLLTPPKKVKLKDLGL